jgi:hypothetical protein
MGFIYDMVVLLHDGPSYGSSEIEYSHTYRAPTYLVGPGTGSWE